MAHNIVKILIELGTVVGRAFGKALRREILESQQAAKARASSSGQSARQSSAADSFTGISLQEAKQILNLENTSDSEKLQQSYEHLFKVNEKAKGGSFYLQSKVVRAKERIDQEMTMEQEHEAKKKQQTEDKGT